MVSKMKKRYIFLILFILLIGFLVLVKTQKNNRTSENSGAEVQEITDTETSDIFHVEREDRSLRSTLGAIAAECYYDKIVFDDEEYAPCNDVIENNEEQFMESATDFLDMAESDGKDSDYTIGNFPYIYTNTFKNLECSEKYVSIKMESEWFAGGVSNLDIIAINMDKAGNEITLADVLNKPEEECLELAYNVTVEYLNENNLYDEEYVEALKSYGISDYHFFLEDGICYLYYVTYEISYGAAGSFAIELGGY
jgi:hypothetical protein